MLDKTCKTCKKNICSWCRNRLRGFRDDIFFAEGERIMDAVMRMCYIHKRAAIFCSYFGRGQRAFVLIFVGNGSILSKNTEEKEESVRL